MEKHGIEIHKVQHKGKTLVLDVRNSACLELDTIAASVLDGESHIQNEISDAVKEMKQLQKMGFFSPEFNKPYPSPDFNINSIKLDITTECNLNCRYCFGKNKNIAGKTMPLSKAYKVVDFFIDRAINKEDGIAENLYFVFAQDREPLLKLDYFKSLQKYINQKNLEHNNNFIFNFFITNGTLLTPEVAEELYGLRRDDTIICSIDGPKYIHDSMRRFPNNKGTYEMLESIILEHTKKWPTEANATLTGDLPYVTEVFLHLFNLGLKGIRIKPVRTDPKQSFAINKNTIKRVKEEYTRFVNFLLSQNDTKLLCYISSLHPDDFLGRFFCRLLSKSKYIYRCWAALTSIAVDHLGYIYPCDSFIGYEEYSLGNVFDSAKEMEEKRKRFISKLHVDEKPVCSECWARYLCGGGCYHAALLANGSIDIPDPINCELVKHLIELSMILLSELANRPSVYKALLSTFRQVFTDRMATQFFLPPNTIQDIIVPSAECKFTEVSPFTDSSVWSNADFLQINRKDQFRGPKIWYGQKDLSGSVQILWNNQFFYIKSIVIDDVFLAPVSYGMISQGDSVKFRFSEYAGSDCIHNFIIAYVSETPVFLRTGGPQNSPLGEVKDSKQSIEINEDCIVYQVAIPWEELGFKPSLGKTYRFNVGFIERDHSFATRAWMEWALGLITGTEPPVFGKITFVN